MIILPLNNSHDRKSFDCGEPSLNEFLQRYARQSAAKRISKTAVAVAHETATEIFGYHTTLVTTIKIEHIPVKLGKTGIPSYLLARLAVDLNQQGKGIGEDLLYDVFRRAVLIAEQTGLYAVVLDALNDRAKKFYLSYGFQELLDDPLHLYLPVETIVQSLPPN